MAGIVKNFFPPPGLLVGGFGFILWASGALSILIFAESLANIVSWTASFTDRPFVFAQKPTAGKPSFLGSLCRLMK